MSPYYEVALTQLPSEIRDELKRQDFFILVWALTATVKPPVKAWLIDRSVSTRDEVRLYYKMHDEPSAEVRDMVVPEGKARRLMDVIAYWRRQMWFSFFDVHYYFSRSQFDEMLRQTWGTVPKVPFALEQLRD